MKRKRGKSIKDYKNDKWLWKLKRDDPKKEDTWWSLDENNFVKDPFKQKWWENKPSERSVGEETLWKVVSFL